MSTPIPTGQDGQSGEDKSTNNNNNNNAVVVVNNNNNPQQPVNPNGPAMLHSFRVFGSRFILPTQYRPLRGLGRGAYGICVSALDSNDPDPANNKRAIKKIPKMFLDLVDAKRILREVKLLRAFDHPNIIKLRDLLPSYGEFEELYIVLDFMSSDLHRVTYSSNSITLDHVRFIMYQLLSGLKYMHDCEVIHRDLKPSNLLINADTTLKICDFGLARGVQTQAEYLTEYVVTRWYRAPEIMCSSEQYSAAIDLWSVGCILGELLNRNPLFAGNDYKQQLSLIFNVLGAPSDEDLAFVTNQYALQYIKGLPQKPATKDWSTVVNCNDAQCLDLLAKLLTFNPQKRITVDEALQHPFLAPYYQNCTNHITTGANKFDDSFEQKLQDHTLTKLAIQQALVEELETFQPHLYQLYSTRYGVTPKVDNTTTHTTTTTSSQATTSAGKQNPPTIETTNIGITDNNNASLPYNNTIAKQE